jgi:hypothetical protein
MSDDPVIDRSHVDNYLRSRHRVEVLNSAWKPALAGAAGAVAIIGAVVVGVWVATPRFSYRDIEIPRVVLKDVPLNNPIPRDVPFDVPVPRVAPPPIARNQPAPRSDAPKTPAEKKFVNKPEYKTATYCGRIVPSTGGGAISFADGMSFSPAHWDEATSQPVYDTDESFDTDGLVGDLAMCVQDAHELWECTAEHNGREVSVGLKHKTTNVSPPANPSPARIRTASETQT